MSKHQVPLLRHGSSSDADIEKGEEPLDLELWMKMLKLSPPKILFLIRVVLLMLSIYIALFIKYIGPQLIAVWTNGGFDAATEQGAATFAVSGAKFISGGPGSALTIFIVALCPIVLVLLHIPATIRDLVIVENVIKQKGRFVEMVRRRQKTARAFRILRLAMQIKHCLKHNMAAPETHYRYIRFTPLRSRPKEDAEAPTEHTNHAGNRVHLDAIIFYNDKRQRLAVQDQWGDPKKLVTQLKPKNSHHLRGSSHGSLDDEHDGPDNSSPHAGSSHMSPARNSKNGKKFRPKAFFKDGHVEVRVLV
jgi:hypothetical protein